MSIKPPPDSGVLESTDPNQFTGFCEYLGMRDDHSTRYDYPSMINHCHKPNTPEPILLVHQSDYCLSGQHRKCPIYEKNIGDNFPAEIRGVAQFEESPSNRLSVVWLIFLVILVGGFGFNFGKIADIVSGSSFNQIVPLEDLPTVTQIPATPTIEATAVLISDAESVVALPAVDIPTLEPTIIPTSAPTIPPTATPLPSPTAFPTPGPGFETPFGPAAQFLIHVVQANESLALLANRYNTSVESLQAINVFSEGVSLWEGKQLVIPVGVTDPTGLPVFSVLYLTQSTDLDEIVAEYSSDLGTLRFFNALGDASIVPAGRWLIIPLPEK